MKADFVRNNKNNHSAAKPVGDLATRLLEPVIARRAGMTIDIVMAWEALAGEKHAPYTMPHKINWPRRASQDDPFKPGTLIVHCDGPRAILFQHETGLIVERVNTFFGFAAIEAVKILQKPVQRKRKPAKAEPKKLEATRRRKLDRILTNIDDPKLRASLERLGKGVLGKRRTDAD